MPAWRPKKTVDWNEELVRQQALHIRHERWRHDSLHLVKIATKLVIAWLLLRHGADMTDVVANAADAAPDLGL